MKRDQVYVLTYITSIDNLPSIVQHGILCHDAAQEHEHSSVADADVQARRANKMIDGERGLHDFANLYFWPRNGMMYRVRGNDICVLTVNKIVLDKPGVWYSNMNAAKDAAEFAACGGDFDLIDRDLLYARTWHGDPDRMAYTQAEVLVPDSVSPDLINDIVVDTEAKKHRIEAMRLGKPVVLRPGWFFL